jgi:hypothetical protein
MQSHQGHLKSGCIQAFDPVLLARVDRTTGAKLRRGLALFKVHHVTPPSELSNVLCSMV